MKKLIIAAIGASLIAGPALAAPNGYGHNDRVRIEQKVTRYGPARTKTVVKTKKVKQIETRRWRKGERFDRSRVRSYRVISSPRAYRLRDAPRGYRWVQSDRDAVMVGITTGLIAAVVANAFN